MDNKYVYEEGHDNEGITIKKVGHFFKKGWLNMVVCAVIAVVLAAIVVLPIKYFYRSEPVARTAVEFTYSGIEYGNDPDGGTFNADNIVSSSVLSKAVADAGLKDKLSEVSVLRGHMRVEAVPTNEYVKLVNAAANGNKEAENQLRNYVMRPTKFNIILSRPEKLQLTDAEAKLLLDKIVAAYLEDFGNRYAPSNPFKDYKYDLSTTKTTFDFADVYDVYDSRLTSISTYLSTLYKKISKSETVYKNRIEQIQSEITILSISYKKFNTYLLANSIWNDREYAKTTLQASHKTLSDELKAKEKYRDDLLEQIKLFRPNTQQFTDVEGTTITTQYSSLYYELQNKYDEANRAIESLTNRIANIEAHLQNLNNTQGEAADALKAKARADLLEIEADSTRLIDAVNSVVDDYNDSVFIARSVNKVQSAVVTRATLDINLVLVLLISAAVGVVVGAIVTVSLISKANAKAKEQKPAEEKN